MLHGGAEFNWINYPLEVIFTRTVLLCRTPLRWNQIIRPPAPTPYPRGNTQVRLRDQSVHSEDPVGGLRFIIIIIIVLLLLRQPFLIKWAIGTNLSVQAANWRGGWEIGIE